MNELKERYRLALEVILKLCEKKAYAPADTIQLICKTAMYIEDENEEVEEVEE